MNDHRRFLLPDVPPSAHIGILGGSFDPPHVCHQLLALSFLALEPIDELWLIPCADHAFKNDLNAFRHRLIMCEIAFKRINKTRVLDIENRLKTPSYTIETINAILVQRPDLKLFLGLGSDLIDSFHTWQKAEKITKKVTIAIFERNSYPIGQLPDLLKEARLHKGYALPNTSSTDLRDFLRQHRNSVYSLLDREVIKYIEDNKLYTDNEGFFY